MSCYAMPNKWLEQIGLYQIGTVKTGDLAHFYYRIAAYRSRMLELYLGFCEAQAHCLFFLHPNVMVLDWFSYLAEKYD